MVELPFARSTFIYKDKEGKVIAACCVHVYDGLVAGEFQHPEFQELIKKIDENFNIKEWKEVGAKPVTYLGMDMTCVNSLLTDDMTVYVQNTQAPEQKGKDKDILNPSEVIAFRRVIMQMRWPAQHVMPEYMYIVSHLAQSHESNSSRHEEGNPGVERHETGCQLRRGQNPLSSTLWRTHVCFFL